MKLSIPVAHDYSCPWCWIGFHQVSRLREEFPITFDWLAYELMPDELDWDPPAPKPEVDPRRPATPSRLTLAFAAEGMDIPTAPRPKQMRTHNAHESTEWMKRFGDVDRWVELLYRHHWEEGLDINDPNTLAELAKSEGHDADTMLRAMTIREYRADIVPFDEAAYAKGVFNVPTFFIGGERYAEQTIVAIRAALREQFTK